MSKEDAFKSKKYIFSKSGIVFGQTVDNIGKKCQSGRPGENQEISGGTENINRSDKT